MGYSVLRLDAALVENQPAEAIARIRAALAEPVCERTSADLRLNP